jgi:hypothetical protein
MTSLNEVVLKRLRDAIIMTLDENERGKGC